MSDSLVLLQIIVVVEGFLAFIAVVARLHMRSQIGFAGINPATTRIGTNYLRAVVVGGHVGFQ